MAYFNNSYNKVFIGTQVSGIGAGQNPNTNLYNGFLLTAGKQTVELTKTGQISSNDNYGVGSFGFFDPETWLSIDPRAMANYPSCCPLVLVSAPVITKDKIGPFAGGYMETNKSKIINPKFIQKIYSVESCTPQQAVLSIGATPYTAAQSPAQNCTFEFLCNETYYLRLDIKGSPALRFMNHQAYQNIFAYTGCCEKNKDGIDVIAPVDPTLVFIDFAKQIIGNPYVSPFVAPVVYDDTTGAAWYAPGTTVTYDGTSTPVLPTQWWDQYVSPGGPYTGKAAGMRLFGAYVDTKFNTCSFQVTDYFEKELVTLNASLVDINGDPCTFEGLCVNNDCLGVQGMGFGEQVLRDLILSQSYLQNYVASNDVRIREITQGDDILNAVDRNALYTRYYILHNVPRYNNPTGMFDSDRYLLEIISTGPNFELASFLAAWSDGCQTCATPETFDCTHCFIEPDLKLRP